MRSPIFFIPPAFAVFKSVLHTSIKIDLLGRLNPSISELVTALAAVRVGKKD
jgi:hypothetical protein